MGLRFDPIGGGQFKRLVQEMIEAERQPIKTLEARKAQESAKFQVFKQFKSKFTDASTSLRDLSSFSNFRELKADVGDGTTIADVTLDPKKARPGTYQVEVRELAKHSAIISNGFDTADEPILGVGYVVVSTSSGAFEVFIDKNQSSLRGVANAINSVADSPIQAEVIQDVYDADKKWKLIMKGKGQGDSNSIEFPDLYFLGGDQKIFFDDEVQAQNALLKVDGFDIEAPGNEIKDFLQGVNLHLKQARPDQPFALTISVDYQKISGKMKDFVGKLNEILKFINDQNKVDDKTNTKTMLTGDTSLQTIEYRLRNLLHEGFPAGSDETEDFHIVHLNEMGVGFAKDGSLTFDEKKFQKNLEDDFQGVSQAITGEMGFAFQMQEVLDMYTRPGDGLLAIRERGMQARIDAVDQNIQQKETQIERKTAALVDRFSKLQGTLGTMQQQSQYLSAAMGGGGGNIVSQLLGG